MTCHKDIKRGCKLSTKTEKQPKIQQNDIILSSILEKMHTKLIKKRQIFAHMRILLYLCKNFRILLEKTL